MKNKQLFSVCLVFVLVALSAAFLLNVNLTKTYDITVNYNYPDTVSSMSDEQDKPDNSQDISIEQENGQSESYEEPKAVYFPLELNLATHEELMYIPKVGNVTAQRIIQYRDYLGGYSKLDQLMEIKGIGKSTYEEISAYLYLTGDDWDTDGN